MSRLWFNIRFGTRHFQWGPDGWSWDVNPTQVAWKNSEPKTWKWFAIYCMFGKHI